MSIRAVINQIANGFVIGMYCGAVVLVVLLLAAALEEVRP